MFLYKHSKETKSNKQKLEKLISMLFSFLCVWKKSFWKPMKRFIGLDQFKLRLNKFFLMNSFSWILKDNWARPIFNLDGNFKQLSKEERLQRDMDHVKSLGKRSSNEFNQSQDVDEILNTIDRFAFI